MAASDHLSGDQFHPDLTSMAKAHAEHWVDRTAGAAEIAQEFGRQLMNTSEPLTEEARHFANQTMSMGTYRRGTEATIAGHDAVKTFEGLHSRMANREEYNHAIDVAWKHGSEYAKKRGVKVWG